MGKLIYLITTTIDGYVADEDGHFEWTNPSEEVLALINSILRNVGTFLLGRNMYETLAVWDTISDTSSDGMNQFSEIWRAANKIVYSTSLRDAATANTTVERVFNPGAIQKLVAESGTDFSIGGPHLAAEAIKAGIVNEYHHFISPVMIGSGNCWLPQNVKANLELISLKKFDNGPVHLHYNQM